MSCTASITLYRGVVDDQPTDIVGSASVLTNNSGYYSTTIFSNSVSVDIDPSNVLVVQTGEHIHTFFVGLIDIQADIDNDMLLIKGPPGLMYI